MPELPEVETVVRGLSVVKGRVIDHVQIFNHLVVKTPLKKFLATLQQRKINDIARHGKSIFLIFGEGACLKIHLGMTGALLVRKKDHPVDPYVRLRFHLDDPTHDVFFRDVRQFGRVCLTDKPYEKAWGPDAWMSSELELLKRLSSKKGFIKNTLLNQLVIAGMGNIYVDETLHAVGIHPRKRLEKLSQEKLRHLVSAMKRILGRSIKAGGTTFRDYVDTQGKRGEFIIQLKVYDRKGEPCFTCGTSIKRMVVAARGTHFCPKCQKK